MWLLAMTLQQATLPTPRFDQITLDNLKQDIQQAIQAGQEFLNTLTAAPSEQTSNLPCLNKLMHLKITSVNRGECCHI